MGLLKTWTDFKDSRVLRTKLSAAHRDGVRWDSGTAYVKFTGTGFHKKLLDIKINKKIQPIAEEASISRIIIRNFGDARILGLQC